MSDNILGKTRVESEKLLAFEENYGAQKVESMLADIKVKAFSGIATFLNKPNAADIDVIYQEKRYAAFWHIIGFSKYDYSKKNKYLVPVQQEVHKVVFDDKDYHVDNHQQSFTLEVIDHCHEEYRKELMIDALSGKEVNFANYLKCEYKKLESTEVLSKNGAHILDIQIKAPFLVRQVMNTLAKPIKADEISREEVVISDLNLFFYPQYYFELKWGPKQKTTAIAIDGVTGNVDYKATKIGQNLSGAFTSEDLFEMGKELAASIIPGGGIAMMVGRKAMTMFKEKK